jgi:hypothetical protein
MNSPHCHTHTIAQKHLGTPCFDNLDSDNRGPLSSTDCAKTIALRHSSAKKQFLQERTLQ